MDKHTPGPWNAELSCIGTYRGFEIKGKSGEWIGNVHANKDRDDRIPQAEANARLIAAAPELLATAIAQHRAIDQMLAWMIEHHPDFFPTKSPFWPLILEANAQQVIVKARGDDNQVECQACYGKGFNDVERQVAERKSDVQTFRETCEACDGTGKVNAGGAV